MRLQNFFLVREPQSRQIRMCTLRKERQKDSEQVIIAPFQGEVLKFYSFEERLISPLELLNWHFELYSSSSHIESTKRKNHIKAVQNARNAIYTIEVKKVVLSRQKVVNGSFSPAELFLKLANKYPNACVFLFNSVETGCWMGATPERLLMVENGKATAASLAGTRPSGTKESWGEKETEEQHFVTEEIKHVFGDSGLTGVRESVLQTKTAGKIEHLFTEVSGQMPDGLSPSALAAILHPTPAVGGLPQKKAVDYILKNEAFSREFYTGYFGIQSLESSRFYVNLRSMQLFKNGLVLYAGGGITSASNPEAEWEETERKLRTLLDVIED